MAMLMLSIVFIFLRVHIVACDTSVTILAYHNKYCKSALCFSNSSLTIENPVVTMADMMNSEETTITKTALAAPTFVLDISPDLFLDLEMTCDICTKCSCEDDCIFYGTCCPDVHIAQPQFPTECVYVTMLDVSGFPMSGNYYMITDCKDKTSNNSNEACKKCSEVIEGLGTEAKYVPVSVNVSGMSVAFKNKFCAQSYGFNEYVVWKLFVTCPDGIALKDLHYVKNVYSSMEDLGCSFAYIPPYNDLKRCSPLSDVVSNCNSTGKWETYNKTIDDACSAYNNPTRVLKNQVFANIFCYLCNEVDDVLTMMIPCAMEHKLPNDDYYGSVAFSAILNFHEQMEPLEKQDVNKCANGALFDTFTDQCRIPVCPELRRYEGDKCEWIVENVQGVEFQTSINMFPNDRINSYGNLTNIIVSDIQNSIIRYFNDSVKLSSISLSLVAEEPPQMLKYIFVVLKFYCEHSFKPQDVIDEILSFQTINLVTSVDGQPVSFSTTVVYPKYMMLNLNTTNSTSILFTVELDLHFTGLVSVVIPVFPENACPRFEYSPSEWVIKDETVSFPSTNRSTNIKNTQLIHSGNISVCVHWTYSDNCFNYRGYLERDESSDVLRVVSVVSLTASLICLFLTFLVYYFVAELHTIPGINLMFLCVSLFFAQGFFLVGAGTTSNHLLCQAFAILIHYFWLVSFCWMNICSLYTFRVFSKVTPSSMKQKKRPIIIKFLAFSNALPLSLIIIVVIIGLTSKSGSIGYGDNKRVCFISSSLTFVMTFLVPGGLTFVLTSTVLVMGGVSLNKVSSRRKALGQKELNILLQCFKLSSLTGVSWIFGSLGSLLHVEVLNYIFIVLCGGQGIFVLLAFVLNKRVLQACKTAVRRKFYQNRKISSSGEIKSPTQRIKFSTLDTLSLSTYTTSRINNY